MFDLGCVSTVTSRNLLILLLIILNEFYIIHSFKENHSFIKYAKFSEKLTFFIPWYVHITECLTSPCWGLNWVFSTLPKQRLMKKPSYENKKSIIWISQKHAKLCTNQRPEYNHRKHLHVTLLNSLRCCPLN